MLIRRTSLEKLRWFFVHQFDYVYTLYKMIIYNIYYHYNCDFQTVNIEALWHSMAQSDTGWSVLSRIYI